jgi:hypothetical protein
MPSIQARPKLRPVLALLALALAALAFAATNGASADPPADKHHGEQRLVVRGDATVVDSPCDAGLCLELTDGQFRGTPVGTGTYSGSVKLRVADAFPNGENGVCAPIDGRIALGAGTRDRLVLAISGDSCQDGAGDPTKSSFTGLAQFSVMHATGAYAGAHGGGLASFSEDAADHDRMTLIGRISR